MNDYTPAMKVADDLFQPHLEVSVMRTSEPDLLVSGHIPCNLELGCFALNEGRWEFSGTTMFPLESAGGHGVRAQPSDYMRTDVRVVCLFDELVCLTNRMFGLIGDNLGALCESYTTVPGNPSLKLEYVLAGHEVGAVATATVGYANRSMSSINVVLPSSGGGLADSTAGAAARLTVDGGFNVSLNGADAKHDQEVIDAYALARLLVRSGPTVLGALSALHSGIS